MQRIFDAHVAHRFLPFGIGGIGLLEGGYVLLNPSIPLYISSIVLLMIALWLSNIEPSPAPSATPSHSSEDRANELINQHIKSAQMLIRRDLELSRANERLAELDTMKTEFISVAAHQLRTPLSGIKWTLSMIMGGDLGEISNEQRTFLMKAYQSNERVIALLKDLLLADQIESGKMTVQKIPLKIGDLLDTLLLEAQPNAREKNISLDVTYPTEAYPQVYVDPRGLRVAFENLIENAVKYTRVGGTIYVKVLMRDPGFVTVEIQDTGIGIPPKDHKRIFSRFFRAQNAIKEVADGSGIGLFIVKRTIEQNHGTIRFDSVEGKGTTFIVNLPVFSPPSVPQ